MKEKLLKGGEFLVHASTPSEIFTPANLDEEARMMADVAEDFVNKEIIPNIERIDKQEEGLTQSLLDKAGDLGLLCTSIPEEFGGLGKDFNTNTAIAISIGGSACFGVSLAAHTGIGTLPILYYGTDAHRAHYLPELGTGKLKAAYCLTEPSSGSDALGAKSKAILSDDGSHYLLSGQKMWITNGGFADIFIVFAKINGEDFTGFIVDANAEGVTRGAEEKKLGIKGSSTRQIFFENVKVPKENILGEIGQGHKIAFNILNIGRFKLCAGVVGGAKVSSTIAIKYAIERKQFNTSIANFGAIKHKLAEQAIQLYVSESSTYRVSDLIDKRVKAELADGQPYHIALMESAEEYAIECAILKVLGSEMLDFVVDETVQVHGGYGFSEEFPAARAYRDSRINRIFEGTNEINRLLTIDMLIKRGMKGEIDLMGPALAVQKELMSIPDFGASEDDTPFAAEFKSVANAKKAILMVAGGAMQKLQKSLSEEQEILMNITDMIIQTYAAESALLRAAKDASTEMGAYYGKMAKVWLSDAMGRINSSGKDAINAFAEGDEQRMMLMGLKRFTKYTPLNTIKLRREIADKLIAEERYCF